MELNEEQLGALKGWIEEGLGLSDIQKRLAAEYDVKMTFMDVRFLLIDNGLELKEEESPEEETVEEEVEQETAAPAPGGVSVELDRLTKPGSIVSGSVVFSDGISGSWSLDQMGRLALDVGDPSYQPSEEDIAALQDQLRQALQQRGF